MSQARPVPMRVIIAGGGTGGHLYPGIAIAEEVTARPGGEVLFVGTARGLEAKLVPAAGFPLELIEVSGLKRQGWLGLLRGLVRLPRAFLASRAILRRYRPDLVIGVGGYASGPIVLAAALSGLPTAIQEQNSHPGLTNRLLGHVVRRVFVAFDDAGRYFAHEKTGRHGNPVRRNFLRQVGGPELPRGEDPSRSTLLVVGGSQGARAVNDLVVEMVAILARRGTLPPHILHQTGAADFDRLRERYAALSLGGSLEVRPYIDDMPAALARAGLVIGRAGALTLAELAIVGCPAILIPLPTAADDHQTRNARAFERAGAAVMIPQPRASAADLADLVSSLLGDPARRSQMAAAMVGLGRPDAARAIVEEMQQMIDHAPATGAVHVS
jgi:UDP-N-acetylglucosamine--N-acetylmuramyl-(pentapeptide) pyrophosphoryl-undecaprenol N-acetylglucosamine transferase